MTHTFDEITDFISMSSNRAHPEPRMELVTVTPELAKQWLSRNTNNRRLNAQYVNRLASDMFEGRWHEATSGTLCISRDGQLMDGQHRLAAIVQTGLTFRVYVLRDADPEDFKVLDRGKSRTMASLLGLAGVPSATDVASTAAIYLRMVQTPNALWHGSNPPGILEFALEHSDELQLALSDGHKVRPSRIQRNSFAAVSMAVRASSEGEEQWQEFVSQCASGVMLTSDSPVYVLRSWATGRSNFRSGTRSQQVSVAFISKAWNAHASGRKVRKIFWRESGPTAELPMPLPIPSAY